MEKWAIMAISIVALAIFLPTVAFAVTNWHCCTQQGCTECASDVLGCNCELKEKLRMEVCSQCAAHGCGSEHEGTHSAGMGHES